MAAPIGNKHAVGHGRPPTEGFEDDKLVEFGEELLRWIKSKDDAGEHIYHLSEWWVSVKDISYSQWKSIIKRPCFLPYYEKAKFLLGVRILQNKDFAQSYGNRYLAMYHADLREHEKEIREEEAATNKPLVEAQAIHAAWMMNANNRTEVPAAPLPTQDNTGSQ